MNPSMQEDLKRDGLFSQIMRRITRQEEFEREFRLKKFGISWIPFGVYINISPMSASPSYPYLVSIDRPLTLVSLTVSFLVSAPNDGGNFWTLLFRTHPGAVALNTIVTSAAAAATWTLVADTTFASSSVSQTDVTIAVECTKTGGPGNLYLAGPLLQVTS